MLFRSEMLGVARDHVTYINYPDGGLVPLVGRRAARDGERAIEGYVTVVAGRRLPPVDFLSSMTPV